MHTMEIELRRKKLVNYLIDVLTKAEDLLVALVGDLVDAGQGGLWDFRPCFRQFVRLPRHVSG